MLTYLHTAKNSLTLEHIHWLMSILTNFLMCIDTLIYDHTHIHSHRILACPLTCEHVYRFIHIQTFIYADNSTLSFTYTCTGTCSQTATLWCSHLNTDFLQSSQSSHLHTQIHSNSQAYSHIFTTMHSHINKLTQMNSYTLTHSWKRAYTCIPSNLLPHSLTHTHICSQLRTHISPHTAHLQTASYSYSDKCICSHLPWSSHILLTHIGMLRYSPPHTPAR